MSTGSTESSTEKARRTGAFARSVGGFTAATSVSRVLGYARDAAIVHMFGAGALTDAFYAAFRIANFFRRTLGEGILTSSFVPVLSSEAAKGEQEAKRFMVALWGSVALVSAGVTLAGVLLAKPIVFGLTYGFTKNPEQFELTVRMTRILFPHLLFVTLAAVAQGALNVRRSFFVPALAPTMFSVMILIYLGAVSVLAPDMPLEARLIGLAIASVAGGALQLLVLIPPLKRSGLGWSRGPLRHPELWTVAGLMLPSMIGMAADHVGTFVNTILASFLEEGSMTAIYNSSRLMQLPLALFGVAAASVALPELSEHASRGRMDAYKDTVDTSLRLTAFLLWPSTVGLIVLALPLVRVLFEHGRFTYDSSVMTAGALVAYSIGIYAYAATKVLDTAFYALRDRRTPIKVGVATVAINIVLAGLLMKPLRVAGLAAASSISAWAGCLMLAWGLHGKTGFLRWEALGKPVLKSLAASLVMGAVCWAAGKASPPSPYLQVLVQLAAGVGSYFALAALFDLEERHLLLGLLRRKGT